MKRQISKKKSIAAAAACMLAASAWAQSPSVSGPATAPDQDARRVESEAQSRARAASASSVSLYGLIDTGVEYISNVGPGSNRLIRMPSLTGSLPSRWGVRGVEDLGDGLRGVFMLESGFGPDTGTLNQGGRSFGRQAFVGLSGGWGTVTLGRQYTMLFWSLLDADVLGPNVYGSGSLDAYIPNARADNAIVYRGTFGGFTMGASYSLGRDVVNAGPSPAGTNCAGESAADSKACREWSVLLKYDAARWGTALAVDEIRGGPGAFAGLTSSALKDRRISANGYVKLGEGQLSAGLIRRDNDGSPLTPRSDLWYVGGSYPVLPALTLDAQVFRLAFKNSRNSATLAAIRGTYHLSKRTALYATVGHISNDGNLALSVSSGAAGSNPVAGGSQMGAMLGMRHSF
ncbi:putative porin [Variovorax paradoxus]|uniref:porin n=1 Tax=Variovorax paradoxus TaxID=34073 RepID=UPI0027885E39|nr:porin [Variovorax paradoxus]MDP9928268.1 putative porin [Variovorax paradoxus]MDQ0024906.1 putative porin [Variovorax paradoxus]